MNIAEENRAFQRVCKLLLEEEVKQLKEKKDDPLLKGKLAQIQLFNEHLEILKQNLQAEVNSIIETSKFISEAESQEFRRSLDDLMKECLNEYLCSSFIKGNGRYGEKGPG